MDDFIIDDGANLLLNKNNSILYQNKIRSEELDAFFKHPLELINTKNKCYLDPIFDMIDIGGARSSNKMSKSSFLKIMPSFINVVKGRILYQGKTKLALEKIHPTDKKSPVILGTIIDLYKVKKVLNKETITKKDITEFINSYDIIPLMYNTAGSKDKQIVYKNKKKNFFSKESKLCCVTFELNNVNSYYCEVPSKEVKINFENIDDIVKDKNFIVSHYIYDNFFFLVPVHKVKLSTCYLINLGAEQNMFDMKETKDFKYEPNNRKIDLAEIDQIIYKTRSRLSSFD
jgi:hypothetical protein